MLVIIAILVLGYYGLVPGVSALFGSNKPRDLGIEHTDADRISAKDKFGVTIAEVAAGETVREKIIKGGSTNVNQSFTGAELAAMAEEIHPVTDMQIKFSEDGGVEVAGIFQPDRFPTYAKAVGITDEEVGFVMEWLGKYPTPNDKGYVFYVKGRGGVEKEEVSLDFDRVEIGRLPVPSEVLGYSVEDFLEGYVEERSRSLPHYFVNSAQIENRELKFDGTVPQVMPRL